MTNANTFFTRTIQMPARGNRLSEPLDTPTITSSAHIPSENAKGNAADSYDAAATSYIVVLDKTGSVVYTGLGGSQNIDAAVRKGIGG